MKFILLCLVIGSAAAMPLFHNESTICEDGNGLCEKAAMKYERIADIQVRVGSRDAPSSGAVRAAGPCEISTAMTVCVAPRNCVCGACCTRLLQSHRVLTPQHCCPLPPASCAPARFAVQTAPAPRPRPHTHKPGYQWDDAGGYCGSWAVQRATLAKGAYISQQQVRDHTSPGGGHDNEILSTNIVEALTNLKLSFEGFDFQTTPLPQQPAYVCYVCSMCV